MLTTKTTIRARLTVSKTYSTLKLFMMLFFLFLLFGPKTVSGGNTVGLFWTAPGDDSTQGRAFEYDIRYSSVPVGPDTTNWWESAVAVDSVPYPSQAGFTDSCVISDLPVDNHFYFAIRTADEANNWSDISNIAEILSIWCIDVNGDGSVNILDVLYLLNFIYKDGPAVPPGTTGDADNSGDINILDAVFMINYCYKNGPAPDCADR